MNFAYFTLVSHDWVIGAETMIKSLRLQTTRPIEILTLEDVTNEDITKLEKVGGKCRRVDRIGSKLAIVKPWQKKPDFCQNCFAKLHMWNANYDKIIYLDADIIVRKNIDHLFYLEDDFGAVRKTISTINIKTKESNSFIDDNHFNAGVLVLTPSKETYKDLMEQKDFVNDEDGSDQSLLNIYFRFNWHRLPQIYNATKRLMSALPEVWERIWGDVCVIHYTVQASDKPWLNENPTCETDKLWWQYYRGIKKDSGPGIGT